MRATGWMLPALLAVAVSAAARGDREPAEEPWRPGKPITIVVPWGAGGAADRLSRVLADELEGPLEQKVVIVNQPGDRGAAGIRTVLDAPRDGCTWAAGAAADLGSYRILGLLDTGWSDWVPYLCVAYVPVVAVHDEQPYQSFEELLQAFRERPEPITVATAGMRSAGHQAIEAIRRYAGIRYRHLSYDGGSPAVLAAAAGKAQVTTQWGAEEAQMLRARKLRALAVLADRPLELKGYGAIPPITRWLPQLKPAPAYYGLFLPAGTPRRVLKTLGRVWDTAIRESRALGEYAAERGLLFDPCWGEVAARRAYPSLQQAVWNEIDAGRAKTAPETAGIPRP